MEMSLAFMDFMASMNPTSEGLHVLFPRLRLAEIEDQSWLIMASRTHAQRFGANVGTQLRDATGLSRVPKHQASSIADTSPCHPTFSSISGSQRRSIRSPSTSTAKH
ncbi:hypothetical protein HBI13_231810 [Parastagonospora nodorum]|nr:hypothetical protein HBI13_231810 [Parastagonospora nodorum]KAH5465708.1 hypothetical protein HBI28_223150 [Parastagonospora nodorum]KAH5712242.1 hypothetical protein HBI20_165550 [Parastagonospora nodorum]